MAILVNRVYIGPGTVLKPLVGPSVIRILLDDPNRRTKCGGVDMSMPVNVKAIFPYIHPGKGVCFEYDYEDPEVQEVFERTAWNAGAFYTDSPHIVAVEGHGIGAWGEGGRWAYNEYRNQKGTDICSLETQLWYSRVLMEAFPAYPFMARMLSENPHGPGSVCIGLNLTPNTYDDVFGHPESYVLQNQIIEWSCEDAFHGIEVYPELQQSFVRDPKSFIEYWQKMNRKIGYMCKFCYVPKNKSEREGLQAIYDFVTGAGK